MNIDKEKQRIAEIQEFLESGEGIPTDDRMRMLAFRGAVRGMHAVMTTIRKELLQPEMDEAKGRKISFPQVGDHD